MYICLCTGISEAKIRELLKTESMDVADLCARTGAGRNCGICVRILKKLVRDFREESDAPDGQAISLREDSESRIKARS